MSLVEAHWFLQPTFITCFADAPISNALEKVIDPTTHKLTSAPTLADTPIFATVKSKFRMLLLMAGAHFPAAKLIDV
jgi:hypothetical protein